MSNFNPLGGSTTTGTSADHGFLSAFSHWLSSILDIITSLLHSTIAFVQFIFALAYDVLQSVFNITKCVTFTAVSFVSGVARSVLGLFQGVVGFIAGMFFLNWGTVKLVYDSR
ncbi:hypothetical protein FA15DRAFT_670837 [Coprinopsis marcescibilis]|uniref:Uncharacterized protein n=1 Tax=Coprinopsis marcescibilis TaxID=230819 RepID=A0A5C3KSC3_COPMA|nr:hypothetical protein FA15DRAFT_670837 [Coprinopsis marcescibilis]